MKQLGDRINDLEEANLALDKRIAELDKRISTLETPPPNPAPQPQQSPANPAPVVVQEG